MKAPTVLIVDSNGRDLATHAAILGGARYSVLQATKIPEAAAILTRHRGRLVVLSALSVADEDGHRFLQETLRKYPFLPFIFTASSPPLNSVLGALRQGAYDFLRIPIPPDILLHYVARAAQKLSLTLEAEKQEKEIRSLLDRSREDLKNARTLSSFKGFMISMAAHDFRSIITVLDGTLQVIKDRCTGCDVTDPGGILEQDDREAILGLPRLGRDDLERGPVGGILDQMQDSGHDLLEDQHAVAPGDQAGQVLGRDRNHLRPARVPVAVIRDGRALHVEGLIELLEGGDVLERVLAVDVVLDLGAQDLGRRAEEHERHVVLPGQDAEGDPHRLVGAVGGLGIDGHDDEDVLGGHVLVEGDEPLAAVDQVRQHHQAAVGRLVGDRQTASLAAVGADEELGAPATQLQDPLVVDVGHAVVHEVQVEVGAALERGAAEPQAGVEIRVLGLRGEQETELAALQVAGCRVHVFTLTSAPDGVNAGHPFETR